MANDREVKASHKIAILGVNHICEIGANLNRDLNVIHDLVEDNESHSLIQGIPLNESKLWQDLADAASKWLEDAVPFPRRSPRS